MLRQSGRVIFSKDNLLTTSIRKQEWLERFGGCDILENTPAVIAELEKGALNGKPTSAYVWSEFDKQCERDEDFPGTRWTEIASGVLRNAARFYFREKPYEGFWMLLSGEIHGAHNRNFYRCDDCGHKWIDEYPGVPDDDCNLCGNRHCHPWRTEELDGEGNLVAIEEHYDGNKEHFENAGR